MNKLSFTIEWDEIYYLIKCKEIPIYSFGNTIDKAFKNMSKEIYDMYIDLLGTNNKDLSEEWKQHKIQLIDLYKPIEPDSYE